ncbi:L-fucose/L-arabinose isomerase family protein [Halanaerobium salsuginis]|uniref:L-arabinose isomerase n=1 Tax=Halanaerobium salsuginis TaxID=29563 RepID=A0A1I4JXY3_9FIRM|nr:L-fucose/L-arabinose isomerase family protein [Halanaerobium salsuginis]SFL71362.1 L-arabinose isomerase [Halanaerobium salsuginis]
MKKTKKGRIGLYTVGHPHYWDQFEGLQDRLLEYASFIEKKMSQWGEIYNYGMVDTEKRAKAAGEWFNTKNVDLLFCYSATYAMSGSHIAIPQITGVPVIVLNLQPTARINYKETTTGEWLAHCGACSVPEISNAYQRCGIEFRAVNGLLGLDYTPEISKTDENTSNYPDAIAAWKEIEEWIKAATVKRNLQSAKMGFLGHTYPGMLDMYSDFTMITSETGMHVEVLEMCDLDRLFETIQEDEIKEKLEEIKKMFILSEDSTADPLAKKPTEKQLDWSARVAIAQDKLVDEFELDALTYYYRGAEGNKYEHLQSGFIVGNSLLTARGIPCAGEGDMKTALAMKIADTLELGGSFCEIVVTDFKDQTILLGHDGPFHIGIASQKPVLRGMGLYHGKWGTGVSVEAKVKKGPITTLGVTQTAGGSLKMIISEGMATDGPVMEIGNTMTPVKFDISPKKYMDRWFKSGPTHHFAMSIGHNKSQFKKIAKLLDIDYEII